MNDDELKKRRAHYARGGGELGADAVAIIDEALSRGARLAQATRAAGRCEQYALATLPGANFCNKNSARIVNDVMRERDALRKLLGRASAQLKALQESEGALDGHCNAHIAMLDEARAASAKAKQERDGMATELERKSKDLRAWEVDARTAQARLKELEAGTTLTQAQTDIVTKAMRESQAALAVERANIETLVASCEIVAANAANARAVAFEEAARWHRAAAVRCRANAADVPKHAQEATERIIQWHERAAGHESDAAQIRALSSSPPSGQWVAADVMELLDEALTEADCYLDDHGRSLVSVTKARAALSALESEASR